MVSTPRDRVYLSPPHMSPRERELLLDAFDSNWVAPLGPHVDAFEREFATKVGAKNAVALSSGTAALQISLRLLGVQAGDHVVTSSLTFAATANAITYLGAKPVFVDSESVSWNIDPSLLERALDDLAKQGTPAKAAIVVDIYGQCADYDSIAQVCESFDVPIIEDAAEALGATYKGRPAGRFGSFGCFSFNGNKIITTSGGGMLVTEEETAAEKARFLATQARDRAPHYEHSEVGYNFRMSNLLAAVGRGQLSVLDQRVAKRRENFAFYQQSLGDLAGVSFMPEPENTHATRWLTCMVVDPSRFGASREDIRLALESENIEARPVWKPMHMQPVFRNCQAFGGDVSRHLFEYGLCLPSGSSLSDADRERVVGVVRRCAGKANR